MDLASLAKEQWQAFVAAPGAFALFAIVLIPIVVSATRAVMGGSLEAARERLAAAKDDIEKLKGEKDTLLVKLDHHGENIALIRAELDSLPRITVSDRQPEPGQLGRDGDLHFVIEKPDA